MTSALRALLEHVVDYAGLYPPASLDVPAAARNYAAYRAGDDRWMLGRFVVGVGKIPELRAVAAAMKPRTEAWPIAVVAPDAAAATGVMRAPDDAALRIESIEVKATTVGEIGLLDRSSNRAREVYVELAIDDKLDAHLDAIAAAKLRAKIRTGGTTSSAFPPAADVVRFMRACIVRDVGFKATAGLHHPLHGQYRLTYAGDAPIGSMFGFFNVFLAAALMRSAAVTDADAIALLDEGNPEAFVIDEHSIAWRAHVVDIEAITATRARVAMSFGSCSFREPVDELPFPVTLPST